MSSTNIISVVIPTLNEESSLPETVAALPDGLAEVVVADGGSRDGTCEIARSAGCRVVQTGTGRGVQMNAGAAAATGDVLLFLHADTRLPTRAAAEIRRALETPGVVAGGFRLRIGSDDPFLSLVAATANLRTRATRIVYGDQALFVRRDAFEAAGRFPDFPIMEDVALGRRLKRFGAIALVDACVTTSARRWERENPLYTTLRNWVLVSLFLLGVSPHVLARWYRPVRD